MRIFTAPEVGKTGESPAKARREARGSRRRTRRRARRMQAIRSLLHENKLLDTFGQDDWIRQYHCPPKEKRDKGPYEWRLEGLDRKLEPEEWAKTLIHLAKRRGFKSNRKGESTGDKEAGKINKAIEENNEFLIKEKIEEKNEFLHKHITLDEMEKMEYSGKKYRTVGEMINKDPKYNERKRNSSKKEIDNPYKGMMTRHMLLAEINVLFDAQEKHGNPHVGFKEKYIEIWEKQIPYGERQDIEKMVGYCQFEPDQKRAPRQSYTYERFSLLQKINQTQIWWQGEKRSLNEILQETCDSKRDKVMTLAYDKKEPTYADLRKTLGMGFRDRFVGIRHQSEATRVREAIKALRAFPDKKEEKEDKKAKPITLFQDEEHINEAIDYIKRTGEISYAEIRKITDLQENASFRGIKRENEDKNVKGLKLEHYQKIKQKIGDAEWSKINDENPEDMMSDIEEICTYAKDENEKLSELQNKELPDSVLQALAKITLKDACKKTDFNNEGEIFFEVKGWHMMHDVIIKNAGENGKEIWDKLTTNAKKETDKAHLDIIAEAGLFYKTDKEIKDYLEKEKVLENFNANEQTSLLNAVSHMHIKEVGNVSIKACQKINPHLAEGMLYHKACEKADYNHSKPDIKREVEKTTKIPGGEDWVNIINNIRNPRVVRAISQARKIVNALIEKYGTPHDIHIELSRDLAIPFDERMKIKKQQEEFRSDKTAAYEQYLKNTGNPPAAGDLLKERLRQKQDGWCPYTGEYMAPQRLGENGYVEIDHILPLSRSMDDSQTNKVLTFTWVNREKSNRIPYEWFEDKYGKDTDTFQTEWERLKAQIKHWRIGRREKMLRTSFTHEEAKEHQNKWVENPTSKWIATSFKDIVEKYLQLDKGDDKKIHVQTRNGALTAFLRAHWGLLKNRDTHQHHALDAVVLAFSTQSMVQKISKWSREEELWNKDGKGLVITDEQTGETQKTKFNKHPFPMPWESFREDLLKRIANVFISSPPRCKMSQKAHADTLVTIKKKNKVKNIPKDSPESSLGLVRGGKPGYWAILRTDIYLYKGKYYHICVRPYHYVKGELPTTITIGRGKKKSDITLDDDHFVCSLYPNDAVLIRKKADTPLKKRFPPEKIFSGVQWEEDEKEAVIIGYFSHPDDSKGQIYIKAHDNAWGRKADFHPAIMGLLEIQKLHIPLLGGVCMDDLIKKKYQVKEEKRRKLNKPPHKS